MNHISTSLLSFDGRRAHCHAADHMEDCKPILPDLQPTLPEMNGHVGDQRPGLSVGVSPGDYLRQPCSNIEPEAIQVNDIGDTKETFMNVKESRGGALASLGLP
jgi:hypothetical protein